MVGRIAPAGSCFVLRELGRRGVLVGAARGSAIIGAALALGVPKVFGAAPASVPDSLVLLDSKGERLPRFSAASAPASRICSSVSPVDFFVRDLGLVVSGAGDSEVVCSEGGGASSLGGSCFFSRATMTSCAWTCPARTNPQNNTLNNPLSIKPDKQIRHAGKLTNKRFKRSAVRSESPAPESEGAIRFPKKSRRDVSRIVETVRRQSSERLLHALPSLLTRTQPLPAR